MTTARKCGDVEAAVTAWPRQQGSIPTAPVPGTLTVTVADGAVREVSVTLAGELDVAHASRVERMLRRLVESGRDASVDASAVAFIDATGVAALVGVRERAESLGRGFVVVSPSASVLRMLELTATEDLLHIPRPADRR